MALTAEQHGAEVRNHAPVVALIVDTSSRPRVLGVRVEDGSEYRARMVVNAAGPWADQVRGLLNEATAGPRGQRPLLTLINGTHIVTAAFQGAPMHAVYHEASADRRPFFVIPWRGLWLIGTTETVCEAGPESPSPSTSEIDYLLRETNLLFPPAGLDRSSVLYAYAGARPLLRGDSAQAQSISRDHAIYDHEEQDGVAGMLTLAGGKLTTARAFADEALARVASRLGRPRPQRRPLPGYDLNGVSPRLAAIYGRRAAEIVALAGERPELDRPVYPPQQTLAAEIVHSVEKEKARTLADILLRRTGLGFEPVLETRCVEQVARLAAPLLAWDEAGISRAISACHAELGRTLYREIAR
jgi:glycerol-3-phosphate dehydrogenase